MTTGEFQTDFQAVRGLLQEFLLSLQEESTLNELSARLDDALAAEVPEIASDDAMRSALDASTHDLLAGFLRALADDQDDFDVPPATLDLARTMALRRHDVGLLLRAYRIGQRLAWSELLPILTREVDDPELRYAALTGLFERMSHQLEHVVDESVTVYTQERDRWLSGTLARKSDLVHAMLRGDPVDVDEATQLLQHRLHRHQLAMLLRLQDNAPETEALSELESVAQAIGRDLDTRDALTLPDGPRSLQVWFGVDSRVDLTGLESVVASQAGLQVACGLPTPGAAGFRASFRQAGIAAKVAQIATHPRRVTRYDEVALVGAFLDDVETMRTMVGRELGGLVAQDATTDRLRETLLAYLRAGGSARDAAEAIGVHKNTVLYRLPRIEELVGHSLDARRLQLEMALEIVEQLGEAAFS